MIAPSSQVWRDNVFQIEYSISRLPQVLTFIFTSGKQAEQSLAKSYSFWKSFCTRTSVFSLKQNDNQHELSLGWLEALDW